jgi:hypothetical protein
MMAPPCIFCGRPSVAWHHISGRPAPSLFYFDRHLVVPVCQRHHDLEHEVARRLGLDRLAPGVDALGHRLVRVADLVARLSDERLAFVLEPGTRYGDAVAGLRDLLLEAAEAVAKREVLT